MDYKEYLKTSHWLNFRNMIIKKHPKCQLCSSDKNLNVHHNAYFPFQETEDDVVVLCKQCHSKHHDKLKENVSCVPGNFWPVVTLDNGRVITSPSQIA